MLLEAAGHLVGPGGHGVELRAAHGACRLGKLAALVLGGLALLALSLVRAGLKLPKLVDLHLEAAVVAGKVLRHRGRPAQRRIEVLDVKVEDRLKGMADAKEPYQDQREEYDVHDHVQAARRAGYAVDHLHEDASPHKRHEEHKDEGAQQLAAKDGADPALGLLLVVGIIHGLPPDGSMVSLCPLH